jgi:Tol biopolymer transport system component
VANTFRRGASGAAAAAAAAMAMGTGLAGVAGADVAVEVSRVSVSTVGAQADSFSGGSAVSATGRYVVFVSFASNLVADDTNGSSDVFVRDRLTGVTRRVSLRPDGQQTVGDFSDPGISADGRYVVFSSTAADLVPGGTDGHFQVFVRDLRAGVTRQASVGPGGRQPNGASFDAALSADGLHVSFLSSASNLASGDTNGASDIFVRDLAAGVTRRVSVGPGGRQADGFSVEPALSANGRYVAFTSFATNLVGGDTNGSADVFVRDRLDGVTRRASVGPGGRQADGGSSEPALSADGRSVVFSSDASNLVSGDTNGVLDVFVRNLWSGTTRRVSVGVGGRPADGESFFPAVSADGRWVSFSSAASNLVSGDTNATTDVFRRDLVSASTRRLSSGPAGRQGDGPSFADGISADGRHVVFTSSASNLVDGDTNAQPDVFAWDEYGDLAVASPART